MKRKYYPHITAAAAVFLTVAPLLLTCTIIYGSTFSFDSEPSLALDVVRPSFVEKSSPETSNATPQNAIVATKEPVLRPTDKHVASEVAQVEKISPVETPLPQNELPSVSKPADGMAETVPVPIDIVNELPMLETGLMAAAVPEASAVASDPAAIEIPKRPDVDSSYYQATGHLALVPQPQVPDPMSEVQASESESSKIATSDMPESVDKKGKTATKSKKDTKPKDRNGKGDRDEEKSIGEMAKELTAGSRTVPAAVEKKPADGVTIEDVAIQTPLESATVSRVEDVVAMTGAKGWPVALVKSDLPDDVWWVQQMVGIQGNSFAARVNFGNEHSVSGTAYHMVIVFLDSPDEVRRFRIAKQFKEIPAGARRSREFNYVRR